MKNINLNQRLYAMTRIAIVLMTGFFITSSLSAAIVLQSGATVSDANTSGNNACVSGIAGVVPSAMTDMNMLLTMYESDCGGTLSVSEVNIDITGSDCGWNYFANYRINEDNSGTCSGNGVLQVAVLHEGSNPKIPTGSTTAGSTGVNACFSAVAAMFAFDAIAAADGYSSECGTAVEAEETGTEVITGNDCGWVVTYTFKIKDACGLELTGQTYTHEGANTTPISGSSVGSTGNDACVSDLADMFSFNAATAVAGYSDGCGGTLTAVETGTEVITGNDCAAAGGWTVTYTFEVEDECGRKLTGQTYTHTGFDSSAPTGAGTYSGTATNGCKPSTAPMFSPAKAKMGYTDNCTDDMNITANLNSTIINGDDCGWTVTYFYNLSDVCNNTSSQKTYQEYGSDMEAPKLMSTAYSDMTPMHNYCLFTTTNIPMPLEFKQVRALQGYVDDCSGSADISAVNIRTTITGSSCGPSGWTLTYTYDVKDICGNINADQSYSHSGENQNGPTFNTPTEQDQILNSSSTYCGQNVRINNIGATNVCGTGDSDITISATDPNGNMTTINLLPHMSNGIIQYWDGQFPLGTSTVTITATDQCLVSSTDEVLITVNDISPPNFNTANNDNNGCPDDITPITLGNCDNDISFTIDASDNCSGVTVDVAFSGNPILPANQIGVARNATITNAYFRGITTVTLTAENPTGQTSTCSFTIEADASCGSSEPNPCQNITEVVTDDINFFGPLALYKSKDITQSDIFNNSATSTVDPGSNGNLGTFIPATHNVAFYGENAVILHPGFETQLGALFLADIEPCSSLP